MRCFMHLRHSVFSHAVFAILNFVSVLTLILTCICVADCVLCYYFLNYEFNISIFYGAQKCNAVGTGPQETVESKLRILQSTPLE